MAKRKTWKYYYSQSVTKATEGGPGVTWIVGLLRKELKYDKNVVVSSGHSLYVGQSTIDIFATNKKSMNKAFKILVNADYIDNIKEGWRRVERLR